MVNKISEKDVQGVIQNIFEKELNRNDINVVNLRSFSEEGVDSIEFMSLLVYLEEYFKIEIDYLKFFSKEYNQIILDDLVAAVIYEINEKD